MADFKQISARLSTTAIKKLSILMAFYNLNQTRMFERMVDVAFDTLPQPVKDKLPEWKTYREQLNLLLLQDTQHNTEQKYEAIELPPKNIPNPDDYQE